MRHSLNAGVVALLGAILGSLAFAAKPALGLTIQSDSGGQIGVYVQQFMSVRKSGEIVVVDGYCLSACTLLLGIIPPERIRFTPKARLGFHAAWMPDQDGNPVTSPLGTQVLLNIYPQKVLRWIRKHGGLSRKMIFLQGRELFAMYPQAARPQMSGVPAQAPTIIQTIVIHPRASWRADN